MITLSAPNSMLALDLHESLVAGLWQAVGLPPRHLGEREAAKLATVGFWEMVSR